MVMWHKSTWDFEVGLSTSGCISQCQTLFKILRWYVFKIFKHDTEWPGLGDHNARLQRITYCIYQMKMPLTNGCVHTVHTSVASVSIWSNIKVVLDIEAMCDRDMKLFTSYISSCVFDWIINKKWKEYIWYVLCDMSAWIFKDRRVSLFFVCSYVSVNHMLMHIHFDIFHDIFYIYLPNYKIYLPRFNIYSWRCQKKAMKICVS